MSMRAVVLVFFSGLVINLSTINDQWPKIVDEAKEIAASLDISPSLPRPRSSAGQSDDELLDSFKVRVFDSIVESVCQGIAKRFKGVKKIVELFEFLWRYPTTDLEALEESCSPYCQVYTNTPKDELVSELQRLKRSHAFNFDGDSSRKPLHLLNKITSMNLESVFPNISIALRIFLTLPVTVATAERSFSKLKLIKNYLRSTMKQERLVDLAILGIESPLARKIDFNDVIDTFARQKARRIPI